MHRSRYRLAPLGVAASCFLGVPAATTAQMTLSPPPNGARTHTIVPGDRYRAGGFSKWLFGSHYRDLWTTPVEATVLNLDSVGGGLTPFRTGGFGQSVSLHFHGGDGRRYVVRSVDKDPTKRLLPQLRGTFAEDIVQDLISALHPTAALAVDPLLRATGILHASHRLVVIPDDPRLGEYREEYAGMLGMLLLHPEEGADNTPGFAGSRRINGSETFFERLENSPCDRVNGPQFLKARLLDFIIGDKDRHQGQWRWAAYPVGECRVWEPIPEDRDQAFIDFDGSLMWAMRVARPQQIRFRPEYPDVVGLTFNGWEVDRELLAELDRDRWDSVIAVVQSELTDQVIRDAVRRLPPEHYALSGERIETALLRRRDGLAEAALSYYELIAKRADVKATDEDEHAEFEHHDNGDVTVRLSLLDPDDDEPQGVYFERRFRTGETKEIRAYLQGGDDRATVRGASGRIVIRVIGGGGDDTFVNESRAGAGLTRFYDDRGDNEFVRGTGAGVDESDYDRPSSADQAHRYALDWGHTTITLPFGTYSPDLGAYIGFTSNVQRRAFRKDPYSDRHGVAVGLATQVLEPIVSYTGRFRHLAGNFDGVVHAEFSGLDIIRFHGFGNETIVPGSSSFFEVRRRQFAFTPSLEIEAGEHVTLGFGPTVEFANTSLERNEGLFIGTAAPYGVGMFGQVGGRVYAEADTRDNAGAAYKGVHLLVEGQYVPEVWDVRSHFGAVRGEVSTYLTAPIPTHPTLAMRGGATKVWGDYPFHEAAYLGGPGDLRGFRSQRFAGDAAVFGNAELRLGLFDVSVLVPGEFGVFGAADAGRVFYGPDPDDADTWHTAFGGGVWLAFIGRLQTLSAGIMSGDDLTGLYVRAGFHF